MYNNRLFELSKVLVWVLRHGAHKLDIDIRPDGYISIYELTCNSIFKKYKYTESEILDVVYNDWHDIYTVQLFSYELFIKANTKHSIILPELKLDKVYPVLISTSPSVKKGSEVYLTIESTPYDTVKYYFIDMKKALNDGHTFSFIKGRVTSDSELSSDYIHLQVKRNELLTELIYCSGIIVISNRNMIKPPPGFSPKVSILETVVVENFNGSFSFPKGKRKDGEYAIETAIRELYEETGFTIGDIVLTSHTVSEDANSNNPKILYFIAYLRDNVNEEITYDKRELESVKWYTIKQSEKLFKGKRLRLLEQLENKIKM